MKRWIVVALIALVVSLVHLQIFMSSLGDKVEPWALDVWFNLRGPIAPPQDVVIVTMDETSYRVLNLPMDRAWPRSMHAKLLKRLAELGAKRVVMDILFLGESSDPAADRELAEAFKLVPTVIGIESVRKDLTSAAGSYVIEELLEPLEAFRKNVEATALVKMTDEYYYIRRFWISRSKTTSNIPTLNQAAAGVKPSDKDQPGERDFLLYYGPPATMESVPYHQVLNESGQLPKDVFKDRVVFVGLSFLTEVGPAQKDSYRTPFDAIRTMYGVEIQATAAANLITKEWINRLSKFQEGLIISIIAFALSMLMFTLRPQWGALVLVGSFVAWVLTSYLSFLGGFFVPGALLFCVVLPVSFLGSTMVYYLVTQRMQKEVERAFQFYLSPEMAKAMRTNPKALSLGGENVFATALFTDIVGFTEVTEGMLAHDVSNMLNAYFTDVMNVVFDKKGTLIKFIGDAVFVIWGAPIKVPDHAKLAAETALAIQREVERFNSLKKFPALHTRIGIHTGPMLVGNLGSEKRFDYTAIGDSVNQASRVEGINKYFGTKILITDSTKKELGNTELYSLQLGVIRVVGKKERIVLHTLFEERVPKDVVDEWEDALNDFRSKKWDDALNHFSAVKEKEPRLHKAIELYYKQIASLSVNPPDEDWAGEVEFSSK